MPFEKIAGIIKEKGLHAADCEYHTIRELENGGKLRALLVKGNTTLHIEYVCPACKKEGYSQQEWKPVSKAAMYRFSTKCQHCGFEIKVPKLKGGKKKKPAEPKA